MSSIAATPDESAFASTAFNEMVRLEPLRAATEAALEVLLEIASGPMWGDLGPRLIPPDGARLERLFLESPFVGCDDYCDVAAVRRGQLAELESWPGASVDFRGQSQATLKRALLKALRDACEADEAWGRAHHAWLAEMGIPTAAESKRMAEAIAKYGWD